MAKKEKKKRSLLGRVFIGLVVLAVVVFGGSAALAAILDDPSLCLISRCLGR